MGCIKAAAIQSGVDPRWSPTEWANHLRWQLAACRENGVDLAVFPAWTGAFQESFPRGYPQEALGVMLRLLGDLSRDAGLYLVPGCIPVRCGQEIVLRGYLLAPDGAVVGWQDQLCPPPGYAAGRELRILPTDLGKIGLILGDDSSLPEVARILALQGAELLCAPAAYLRPYNPWQQAAGLWQAAQANQVAAIEACLVGEFNGHVYQGRSAIILPAEQTPNGDGILAQAAGLEETEVIAHQLDLEAINAARAAFPFTSGFNPALCHSLPEAYLRICGRSRQPEAGTALAADRAGEPEGGYWP